MGYVVGFVLRVGGGGGGESKIGLLLFIKYPYYDEETEGKLFPFRTLAMVASFVTIVIVSYLLMFLFKRQILPSKLDFLHCFREYDFEKSDRERNENYPMTKRGRARSSEL